MSILYPNEHFTCYNYDKGKNTQLEILKISKGEKLERNLFDTQLIFVVEGKFRLSYGKILNKEINTGKIIMLPPGTLVRIHIQEDTHLIIAHIRGVIQLCECASLEHMLANKNNELQDKFHMLEINDRIREFINFLLECINDGLKCTYYFETKMKELFFLLRAYYSKKELAMFFSPLLSHDSRFMNLMYQNYREVKSIQELANISRYSESGFKKQFTKVFGTSASDWLRDQKASLVFHDLNCSELSIKELADKYKFSSVSSFTAFCQNKFGFPPGQLRASKRPSSTCADKNK